MVTGGSRGIGRESAERLAADGFAVVVNYAGNRTEAEAAVAAITAAGGEAVAQQADVADEVAVAALFDAAEAAFGGIDVVVHAAGVMALAPLAELELDTLDRMHRTNIRGTFVVDQQAVLRLREGGAIINFSSSVLSLALPGYTAYAATKGAVEAMTLILAVSCAAGTSPSTPSRPGRPPPHCSWTARTRRPSHGWPPSRRWSGWESRRT